MIAAHRLIYPILLGLASSTASGLPSLHEPPTSGESSSCRALASQVSLVREFNAEAWAFAPEAKALQIKGMESSAAVFYRMTPYVFYRLVQDRAAASAEFAAGLAAAGTGPILADVHPDNVVWGKGSDRRPMAWVNDYDDTATAPRAADILRSIAGILAFIPQAEAPQVSEAFLAAYQAGLSGDVHADYEDALVQVSQEKHTGVVAPDAEAKPQPPMPDGAGAAVDDAFAAHAAELGEDPAISCPVSYLVYAGGSSLGLPRFRLKCGKRRYEIKAARSDAWDFAAGKPQDPAAAAARIASGTAALAPAVVGASIPLASLFGQTWSGPWSYYLHERKGQDLAYDGSQADAPHALATVLGQLMGEAHRRSGAPELSEDAVRTLERFVPAAASELTTAMNALAESLPPCL